MARLAERAEAPREGFASARPARLAHTGCSLLPRTPTEFGTLLAVEIENQGGAHHGFTGKRFSEWSRGCLGI
jgi:hypothetical protein